MRRREPTKNNTVRFSENFQNRVDNSSAQKCDKRRALTSNAQTKNKLQLMVETVDDVASSMRTSFSEVRGSVSSDFMEEPLLSIGSSQQNGLTGPMKFSSPRMSPRRISIPHVSPLLLDDQDSTATISDTQVALTNHPSIRPLQDFTLQYHASVIAFESFNLASFLFHGTPRWIAKFVRLMCFVIALLPAFMVFGTFYFITSDRLSFPYKKKQSQRTESRTSRHYLDLYGSTTTINGNKRVEGQVSPQELKPVVIFLTGGAWIIGYKMWGALLARALVPFGIMVIIPDYRNFPQSNIEGMIDDVDWAVDWTLKNCRKLQYSEYVDKLIFGLMQSLLLSDNYGGNPNKVVIVGQSAGAHIGACLMLRKAKLEAPTDPLMTEDSMEADTTVSNTLKISGQMQSTWHAIDVKGFIAVSGPYDLVAMRDILHEHGLDKSIVSAMFRNDLAKYSPTVMLRGLHPTDGQKNLCDQTNDVILQRVQSQFPPTCVIHGQIDKTVPFKISLEFYEALRDLKINQPISFKLYPSWSHTDPILEAPFAGNHLFHRDVYDLVKLWTTTALPMKTPMKCIREETDCLNETDYNEETIREHCLLNQSGTSKSIPDGLEDMISSCCDLLPFDENHVACRKICPMPLVQLARVFNPF